LIAGRDSMLAPIVVGRN